MRSLARLGRPWRVANAAQSIEWLSATARKSTWSPPGALQSRAKAESRAACPFPRGRVASRGNSRTLGVHGSLLQSAKLANAKNEQFLSNYKWLCPRKSRSPRSHLTIRMIKDCGEFCFCSHCRIGDGARGLLSARFVLSFRCVSSVAWLSVSPPRVALVWLFGVATWCALWSSAVAAARFLFLPLTTHHPCVRFQFARNCFAIRLAPDRPGASCRVSACLAAAARMATAARVERSRGAAPTRSRPVFVYSHLPFGFLIP